MSKCSPCLPPPRGGLLVVIDPPAGLTGSVVITGKSYRRVITKTTRLNVRVGTYTITPANIRQDQNVVDNVYSAPVQTAVVVKDRETVVTVVYTFCAPSGKLWLANTANNFLDAYRNASLQASGSQTPDVAIGAGAHFVTGIMFDGDGNALVTVCEAPPLVLKYAAADLNASGSPTPLATFQVPNDVNACPSPGAFDAAGNLWISDPNLGNMNMYLKSQLEATGTVAVTPARVISGLTSPSDAAFDAAGNMWVPSESGGTVIKFTPAQLAVGGALAPDVTLTMPAGAGPTGLAFLPNGDLYVISFDNDKIYKLSASQLLATGSPVPAVTVSLTPGDGADYGALDEAMSLWVSCFTSNKLKKFTAAQLSVTGAPVPAVTIDGTGFLQNIQDITFMPHPVDVPILLGDGCQ